MHEIAVFGGGCFWCTEAVFRMLQGVVSVAPGYAGGDAAQATYEAVSTGKTDHAEVIQIVFNPTLITYETLLKVFFESHDPTTLNRQGADVGTQYRSVIFTTSEEQQRRAHAYIEAQQAAYTARIVTAVEPLDTFYPAEDYHADYFAKNSRAPYCQIVIAPKVASIQKKFTDIIT